MNIARKKASGIALMIASAMMGSFGFSLMATAQAATEYDPGFLLADGNMYTAPKMSVAEIQQFLNDKGRNCRSGNGRTCLKDFKMKAMNYSADKYCPNGYVSSGVETAAQIIYKAAKACNIAPEVILVTLQKEQSLITNAGGSWAYRATMGFNCPDSSPCAHADFGFQHQVYRGARQFQVYRLAPGYFNHRVKQTSWVGFNPSSHCGGSNVYMQTQATAALYNYTPYQPNSIVLKRGYVSSNGCGTYGNYNFVNYYRQWFGDPKVVRGTSKPAPKPTPAKPVTNSKANNTGTSDNLSKEKTGPVKAVNPVSKPVAKAVPTIESAVIANGRVAAGSSVLPNATISFELVNLKPNQKPALKLNSKVVQNPGIANAEGKLVVKVNTGTAPNLVFAIQDNGTDVSVFKANVVTEIKPNSSGKKVENSKEKTTEKSVNQKPATDSKKPVDNKKAATDSKKPIEKYAPRIGAVIVGGKSPSKNQQLRTGDEITVRIQGVSKDDIDNSATELYFHSSEKVMISKNGKWDNGAYILNIEVPAKLSNGSHGIFIKVKGKEVKLYDFVVNNPVSLVGKTSPVNNIQSGSHAVLAETGAEAGVVFVIALLMLVGGVYLVIGAQQNRPIRVNC